MLDEGNSHLNCPILISIAHQGSQKTSIQNSQIELRPSYAQKAVVCCICLHQTVCITHCGATD